MGTVARLKHKDHAGDADPLRAAIAAAIASEREAREAVVNAEQNLERGHIVAGAAEAELEKTKTLLGAAKQRDARSTAAAMRRSADAAPDASTTRAARVAIAHAEDLAEVSQEAVGRLRQDLEERQKALLWASNSVLVARAALMSPVFEKMLEAAAAGRMLVATTTAVLIEFLNRDRPGPDFGNDFMASGNAKQQRDAPLVGVIKEAERFITHANSNEEHDAARAAVRSWTAAVAALATDPSVELPGLP